VKMCLTVDPLCKSRWAFAIAFPFFIFGAHISFIFFISHLILEINVQSVDIQCRILVFCFIVFFPSIQRNLAKSPVVQRAIWLAHTTSFVHSMSLPSSLPSRSLSSLSVNSALQGRIR